MAIEKLTAGDPDTQSADPIANNLDRMRELFPEVFAEGRIDFDVLRQALGDAVEYGEERYGLNWRGKRAARRLALTPSSGTLRPAPNEAVDWETTQNLMIEGDNLEVLKLLRKSYAGKVKLIYIDPPYNTGGDFIYPDRFQDSIQNYLEITGQLAGGVWATSNTETSGRYHTAWLDMIYPRLLVARDLLRPDGVIFISIDDSESGNLRMVCDEIFGHDNFVADISVVSNLKGRNDRRYIARANERVLMYVRSEDFTEAGLPFPDARIAEFREQDERGRFRLLGLRKRGGPDTRAERPKMYFPIYVDPASGAVSLQQTGAHSVVVVPQKSNGVDGRWRWGKETVARRLPDLIGRPVGSDGRFDVFERDYLEDDGELRRIKPKSVWTGTDYSTDGATKAYRALMPDMEFPFPKPVGFLRDLITYGTAHDSGDLVLDFFSGSGTTAHAAIEANQADSGNRRYVMVQLPEPTGRPDYRTIPDIAKERLRRVAANIRQTNSMFAGDLGFRVFKLDSSNIREWDPQPEDLEATLDTAVENLKADRTEQDILYELLLKRGIELTVPIETREIASKAVHSIGAGTLFACLAERIERADAEPIALGIVAWRDELAPAGDIRVVFRDSAFVDDVAKTNLAEILRQHGLADVKSI